MTNLEVEKVDYEALMQEDSHGEAYTSGGLDELTGGYSIVTPSHGRDALESGMTAHRGVLHPDEYVEEDTLRSLIERSLGFTYDQIRSVYRQGPLSPEQRQLRRRIDARMLAISRSGGNMAELARAIGFTVKPTGDVEVFKAALARARDEEEGLLDD